MKKPLLLIAIALVLAATYLVKRLSEERQVAASEAAAERPEARANRALTLADEAERAGNAPACLAALTTAKAALDEAQALRPEDLELRRARTLLAARLGVQAKKSGDLPAAKRHLEEGLSQALATLDAHPDDDTLKLQAVTLGRALVELLTAQRAFAEAEQRGQAVADAVEAKLGALTPSPQLRASLAALWLSVGRLKVDALGLDAEPAPTPTAAARDAALLPLLAAKRHADALAAESDDVVASLNQQYSVLAQIAELALTLEHPDAAARLKDTLACLALRRAGRPDDLNLLQVEAAWLVALAELEAKTGALDPARISLGRALALRRQWLATSPTDEAREALVMALSTLGALESKALAHPAALSAYTEAVALAEPIEAGQSRALLLALGNHAQALGRADRIKDARELTRRAYALALHRLDAHPDQPEAIQDAAAAGLRHARLLRAVPSADRAAALSLAKTERARLSQAPPVSPKTRATLQGLEALIDELK